MTHTFLPASTAGTMRSPAWEVLTRGPKKSPATTLTVFVGEASLRLAAARPDAPLAALRRPRARLGHGASGSLYE